MIALSALNPWKTEGNVLCIGGGPIGLFTAAQIKALNPLSDVHVYEKYHHYQRRHVVQVRHSSLKGAPDHPAIQRAIQQIKTSKPRGWIWKTSTISTQALEEILETTAKELGVKVHKGYYIQDPQSIIRAHANPKVVIGADGAHSPTRKALFNHSLSTVKTLDTIAEVKYLVHGRTSPMDFKQLYVGCKLTDRVVTEHVGKRTQDGLTPVTVRFSVSAQEHEALQNATYKHPFSIEQCPKRLKQAIGKWFERRHALYNDIVSKPSVKVTRLALGHYMSPKFVKQIGKQFYALCGDSAVGIPYFSSLNFGLCCSVKLAQSISTSLESPDKTSHQLNSYGSYVKRGALWEVTLANIKSFAIGIFKWIVKINRLMPWQFIR